MALPSLSSRTLTENQGDPRNTLTLPFWCSPDPRTPNQTRDTLFDRNERELPGSALDEARERAKLEFPLTPTLGECYLIPGQNELLVDTGVSDSSSIACSQMRILLVGLQSGGSLDVLTSLWTNLGLEAQGYTLILQYDWKQERVFVNILFRILILLDIDSFPTGNSHLHVSWVTVILSFFHQPKWALVCLIPHYSYVFSDHFSLLVKQRV